MVASPHKTIKFSLSSQLYLSTAYGDLQTIKDLEQKNNQQSMQKNLTKLCKHVLDLKRDVGLD